MDAKEDFTGTQLMPAQRGVATELSATFFVIFHTRMFSALVPFTSLLSA